MNFSARSTFDAYQVINTAFPLWSSLGDDIANRLQISARHPKLALHTDLQNFVAALTILIADAVQKSPGSSKIGLQLGIESRRGRWLEIELSYETDGSEEALALPVPILKQIKPLEAYVDRTHESGRLTRCLLSVPCFGVASWLSRRRADEHLFSITVCTPEALQAILPIFGHSFSYTELKTSTLLTATDSRYAAAFTAQFTDRIRILRSIDRRMPSADDVQIAALGSYSDFIAMTDKQLESNAALLLACNPIRPTQPSTIDIRRSDEASSLTLATRRGGEKIRPRRVEARQWMTSSL